MDQEQSHFAAIGRQFASLSAENEQLRDQLKQLVQKSNEELKKLRSRVEELEGAEKKSIISERSTARGDSKS